MTVLAASFVIVTGLALWTVPTAHGPVAVKAAAIVAVPAFGFAVWHTGDGLRGWPTGDKPPANAQFLAGSVREPEQGRSGAIFLWLTTGGSPRAYRLPYTRQLHKQVVGASAAAKGGRPVAVARARAGRAGRYSSGVRFYRLPPAQAPRKTP